MGVNYIFYSAAKELFALSAAVLYSIFLHVTHFSDSIPVEVQVIENKF